MRTLVTTYDCAIAFPETSLPKFSSESNKVTINPSQKVPKHAAKSPGNGMIVFTTSLLPLRRLALCDLALLLQVNIPALRCTSSVFQGESEDSIALLDSVF